MSVARSTTVQRETAETRVTVQLCIDGSGSADVRTGIGFLDHLLTAFARHGRLDLVVKCEGDLHIDDHHTSEDVALSIGQALRGALADRRGITRFGYAIVPLDEALSRAAIDISGRPLADIQLGLTREAIGTMAAENIPHVLRSFAMAAQITLHVDVLKGVNDHHRAESAFKATAIALREAVAPSGFDDLPSTKEFL
jgi:imidazoleglycerol-phosphate dehydratase